MCPVCVLGVCALCVLGVCVCDRLILPFAGGDVFDPVPDVLWPEGGEAEARASGLQRGDDLGHVVADQTEPRHHITSRKR